MRKRRNLCLNPLRFSSLLLRKNIFLYMQIHWKIHKKSNNRAFFQHLIFKMGNILRHLMRCLASTGQTNGKFPLQFQWEIDRLLLKNKKTHRMITLQLIKTIRMYDVRHLRIVIFIYLERL